MAKNKKQHFVPSCYLKAWCDPATPPGHTSFVWMFSKDGSVASPKAPTNIFHESDTYTITGANGERNLSLETFLNRVEDRFTRIRRMRLDRGEPMERQEHIEFCLFVAAAHCRTVAFREHQRKQWAHPLKVADDMAAWLKKATLEQKRAAASPLSSGDGDSISHEQVRELVERPLQNLLLPSIKAEAPRLATLDLALFEADGTPGFITSDHPCVWFDPTAYRRHPMWRAPGLAGATIEITLPIYPSLCAMFNRSGMTGYQTAPTAVVDEINRRTRFRCREHFIVNSNSTNPKWFDPGKEPADSWENMNPRPQPAAG